MFLFLWTFLIICKTNRPNVFGSEGGWVGGEGGAGGGGGAGHEWRRWRRSVCVCGGGGGAHSVCYIVFIIPREQNQSNRACCFLLLFGLYFERMPTKIMTLVSIDPAYGISLDHFKLISYVCFC